MSVDQDQQRRLEALHELAVSHMAEQAAAVAAAQAAETRSAESRTAATKGAATRTRLAGSASASPRRIVWSLLSLLVLLGLAGSGTFLYLRAHAPRQTGTTSDIKGSELLVVSNYSAGKVILNGKVLDGIPPLIVHLAVGQNTIIYSAAPFGDRTCHIAWGPTVGASTAPGDQARCGVSAPKPPVQLNGVTATNGYLGFGITGSDLPPGMPQQVEGAIDTKVAAIQISYPVPAGDHIATGLGLIDAGRIGSARVSRQVTAVKQIAVVPPTVYAGPCALLGCPGQLIMPDQGNGIVGTSIPAGLWRVEAPLASRWVFHAASGGVIAASTWDTNLILQIALVYSGGVWQIRDDAMLGGSITQQVEGNECNGGSTALSIALPAIGLSPGQLQMGSHSPDNITANGTGCAIIVRAGSTTKFYGAYVWRWGVLMAAEPTAHALLPNLPVASAAEIAAVGGISFG